MMTSDQQALFQRQQNKIYPSIAQELISLTPEHWKSVVLELTAGDNTVSHSIYSEDGNKDIIMPSMELFNYTYKLELLFRQFNCMWEKAFFRIRLDDTGQWKYQVDYEYAKINP
jgi:hypothetical protein